MEQDRSEVITITPEMASAWLENRMFSGQRSVRPGKVEYLVNEILHDRMEPAEMRLCHLGEQVILTNGQHRLHAIIKAGRGIKANVFHRYCESEDEVKADYASVDVGGRNQMDRTKAYGLGEFLGFTSRQVETFSGCLPVLIDGFVNTQTKDPRCISVRVRCDFMFDWANEAQAYKEIACSAEEVYKSLFWRSQVMSVAMVTLRHCRDKALTFWTVVADNNGLIKGNPARACLQFLLAHKARGEYSQGAYARFIASTWNAYHDGRPLIQAGKTDEAKPILIKGTPYDGKKYVRLGYE